MTVRYLRFLELLIGKSLRLLCLQIRVRFSTDEEERQNMAMMMGRTKHS